MKQDLPVNVILIYFILKEKNNNKGYMKKNYCTTLILRSESDLLNYPG